MDFNKIKYVYLFGIGGIGMSALARYFKAMGKVVSGYDRTPTTLTEELISENIAVHFEDDIKNIPVYVSESNSDEILFIYTPAIPKDHAEYNFIKEKFTVYKRSQILGFITQNTNTIAVAGTHGKTTTSTLIAHLLKQSGVNCTAFLGGISKNYNTNLLLGDFNNSNHVVVVEADEFDRSFLTLFPQTAIVTSMDADHLDIYGDHQTLINCYQRFAHQISKSGLLIKKSNLDITASTNRVQSYSISQKAEVTATDIRIINHEYVFDFVSPVRCIRNLKLGLPGRHNVENAVAAIAVAIEYHLTDKQIADGLTSYAGVKRRFDYQIKNSNMVYLDDYAHHPEELSAAISSIKELYPDKRLTVVFQPHLYSRTKDFADGFASSLSLADETILLPIYPARELPIEGVNAEMILNKMTSQKMICDKNNLLNILKDKRPELLMTLGAGDIDQFVDPIRNMFSK